MKMNDLNVLIAVPCYDAMPTETVDSLIRAERELPFQKTISLLGGGSHISRVRNAIAAMFLRGNWTHLLFIDADMLFEPAHVIRLLSHDEAIVGGLYSLKDTTGLSCSSLDGSEYDTARGLTKVLAVGTGFLAIRREVFEEMIKTFGAEIEYFASYGGNMLQEWDFFSCGVYREPGGIRGQPDGLRGYYTEDCYFCARARQLGFTVYVDTLVLPRHIGKAIYPLDEKRRRKAIWATQECIRLAGFKKQ